MTSQTILELWPTSSLEEVQTIIRAVYKQVLGNPHVMESERLVTAESQLCDRSISVREFVRAVAKSDFYRNRYFSSCAPYRFVELNFLHLLGRAPQDQREVSEHIIRTVAEGYDAEIDSYIDSNEYETAFGENIVPYYRGKNSAANPKQVGYNRIFALDRGPAQIDSAVKSAQLVYAVATNSANAIKPSSSTVIGSGTEKRFKILVKGSKFDSPRRISTTEYIVPASKMTPQIQRINRTSGKIVSITEIV
ncbi:phycobilisome rod-core linker polypeptide [Calothrix sp. FACHB-1219]|uniref:phycobilisome rod-core linker polypeptide n=1 Tax=unclassified Calothrix TaxID=2619626 RepID=UPI00168A2042|nr:MULTISPECIES: phycobilisome rod-core linker polypeptide [unclassified Calothrix]MBD2206686.1 phycobilisome rod-core linker polypeptide [Calothrix sp. FACHB-168]MBD2219676.1 phycobilisome rod-core linker polypeptide [Calothrix sp. FACHB-1219]